MHEIPVRPRASSIAAMEESASRWLLGAQNSDGGWGVYEDSGSRVVNTCEALLALWSCGERDSASIRAAIAWLVEGLEPGATVAVQYQRHYAFLAMTCASVPFESLEAEATFRISLARLMDVQNVDGGWAHFGNDGFPVGGGSCVYATYLGIMAGCAALRRGWIRDHRLEAIRRCVVSGALWLMNVQAADGSWPLEPEGEASVAATSFAIIAIKSVGDLLPGSVANRGLALDSGASFLVEHIASSEGEQEAHVGGNATYNFHHFTLPWAILAMASAGRRPWEEAMWGGILRLAQLQTDSGGWSENRRIRPTVWATYAAITCFSNLVKLNDPLVRLLELLAEVRSELTDAKDSAANDDRRSTQPIHDFDAEVTELRRRADAAEAKLHSWANRARQSVTGLALGLGLVATWIGPDEVHWEAAQTHPHINGLKMAVSIVWVGLCLATVKREWRAAAAVAAVLGGLLAISQIL